MMKPLSSSNLQKQPRLQIENEQLPLPYIPDEIIFDGILVRLPVKSLVWFRAVCKGWNRRIQSKDFVKRHLKHHSSKDTDYLLLAKSGPGNERLPKMLVMSIEENNANSISPIYRSPPHKLSKWMHNLDGFKIISSCRGLVCAVDSAFPLMVYVWNPFTGAYKEIRCPACSSSGIRGEAAKPSMTLGYDPVNKDYKIVRVCPSLHNDAPLHFKILSLKNKMWKTLRKTDANRPVGTSTGLTLIHQSVASDDGHLYMAVTGRSGSEIYMFNLMEEKFTRINDPPMAQELYYGTFKLGLYNGALCLYYGGLNRFDRGIGIWTLVSDESWTKLMHIPENNCREEVSRHRKTSWESSDQALDIGVVNKSRFGIFNSGWHIHEKTLKFIWRRSLGLHGLKGDDDCHFMSLDHLEEDYKAAYFLPTESLISP